MKTSYLITIVIIIGIFSTKNIQGQNTSIDTKEASVNKVDLIKNEVILTKEMLGKKLYKHVLESTEVWGVISIYGLQPTKGKANKYPNCGLKIEYVKGNLILAEVLKPTFWGIEYTTEDYIKYSDMLYAQKN